MAKNIIQDVIAKNRRSIRQIPVSGIRCSFGGEIKKNAKEYADISENEKSARKNKKYDKFDGGINFQKLIIWAVAMLSLAFFLFSLASYFSTATVVVTSKTVEIMLDDSYVIKKNASSGELQYEIMSLQKKISKQLEASESKNLQIKATGKITVYNNFSASPQKFIKNTRFESSNGLIYKIPESIIVPGKKTVGSKQVPGFVETIVFADSAGSEYNVKVSDSKNGDFRVAGFKGDKKYDYFYGQIKSDIEGGVNGMIKKVADKTYEDTISEIRASLKSELVKEAYSTKPKSAVLLDGVYFIDFVSLPNKALGGDKIEITESAIFYGVIFDKIKLGSYVASKKIINFDGAPADLVFSGDAKISVSNDSKSKSWESETLNLNLKGEAEIIWVYDKTALQDSLAGYPKKDLNKFLSSHPEFSDASFKIRPFWKRFFPANPGKIKIENLVSKK